MWHTEYSATTSANPEAVFSALRALHSGEKLGPNSDDFELHGPFAVGTTVTVTPQGQDAMTSVITELDEPRVYADQTAFGGLVLTFRHVLRSEGGLTRVTHQLEIDGEGSNDVGPELGPQISGDFAVAMAELLAAAEACQVTR